MFIIESKWTVVINEYEFITKQRQNGWSWQKSVFIRKKKKKKPYNICQNGSAMLLSVIMPPLKDGATLLCVVIRILHIQYNVAGWYYPTSEQFYIIQCGHPNSKYTLQWHCVLLPHLLKDSSRVFRVVSQTPQILYNGPLKGLSSIFESSGLWKPCYITEWYHPTLNR